MSDDTSPQAEEVPRPAKAPAAKPEKKKPAKAKAKSGSSKGKSKGKGKGKKEAGGVSVASHPRAHSQVRRAKGWGGLAGFGIAAYLGFSSGVPPNVVGLRALAAGIAGYLIAWAISVTVWRHLLLAEIKARYEQHKATAPPGLPIGGKHGGPTEDAQPAKLPQ